MKPIVIAEIDILCPCGNRWWAFVSESKPHFRECEGCARRVTATIGTENTDAGDRMAVSTEGAAWAMEAAE